MSEIKAVIFDWGGVLVDNPRAGLVEYCSKGLGVAEKNYLKAYHKFDEAFHKGQLSEDDFWANMCNELKVDEPNVDSLWGQAFEAAYSPKEEVFCLIDILKSNSYKIGFLSNTEEPSVVFFYKQGYDVFDAIVFSCEVGFTKPQKEIYELAIGKLGVEANQAVFIDDIPEYIDGAHEAGLNGIVFKDIEQLKNDLEILGVKVN